MNMYRLITQGFISIAFTLTLGANLFAQSLTPVSVGLLFINADGGMFIAQERGYFEEEGLDVTFDRFRSGADIVSLLATGRMDVGSGSITPGMYNSIRQGLDIQIVGSKSMVIPPDFGGASLVVRQDLWENGEIRNIEDLRDRRIALNNVNSTSSTYVNRALNTAGMGMDDIEFVTLPLNQLFTAFNNKQIDAAWIFDPLRGALISQGFATGMPGTDTTATSPGDPTNLLYYSRRFADNTNAARGFMVAHLRGLRDYFDAVVAGTATIDEQEDIFRILSKYTEIPVANYRSLALSGVHPNGIINSAALWRYQEEWLEWGIQQQPADIDRVINEAFLEYAWERLGKIDYD